MPRRDLTHYIASLPVGLAERSPAGPGAATSTVDVDELPRGVVTGSNLIEFEESIPAAIRSAVALSLLAAQRVAANDGVVQTPDQWLDRHNTVLQNLNWLVDRGGQVDSTFDSVNVALHEAIVPFVTVALGGAATATSLIVAALRQLGEIDKTAPWITLFDRESRRFDVTEYQFSYVTSEDSYTMVRMAAARLDARYGRTQVLFFKIRDQEARFQAVRSTMRAERSLLQDLQRPLRAKLADLACNYIRELQIGG